MIVLAEEKDCQISRLKYLSECKDADSSGFPTKSLNSTDEINQNRIDVQRRKIDGLMKLIQEKNQSIDSLKFELTELKQTQKEAILGDLSPSFSNLYCNNEQIKITVEFLEKEIQIYKDLNNGGEEANLAKQLTDMAHLRNQLLKATSATNELLNSSSNFQMDNENTPEKLKFGASKADNGIGSKHGRNTSSIPRLVSHNSSTCNSSPTASHTSFSTPETDQLIIQKLTNQISGLKQELEKKNAKVPKVIEIHNELSSLRERYDESQRLNEYLRKQVEIYHITHGNMESLIEMAHKLNLTQDELDQYKEKLSKIKLISESLPTNQQKHLMKEKDFNFNSSKLNIF